MVQATVDCLHRDLVAKAIVARQCVPGVGWIRCDVHTETDGAALSIMMEITDRTPSVGPISGHRARHVSLAKDAREGGSRTNHDTANTPLERRVVGVAIPIAKVYAGQHIRRNRCTGVAIPIRMCEVPRHWIRSACHCRWSRCHLPVFQSRHHPRCYTTGHNISATERSRKGGSSCDDTLDQPFHA